jgi:hypothetical protein
LSVRTRAAALIASVLVAIGLGVFVSVYYIDGASRLPVVSYTASDGVVNVVLQTAPLSPELSGWVTYFIQDPAAKTWKHTTLFSIPPHSRIHVTMYSFDSCTPLRDNYWGEVQGTIGDAETVAGFNPNGQEYIKPYKTSEINSWSDCNVAHTFLVPDMGLYVPIPSPKGMPFSALCTKVPCSLSGNYYLKTTFDFTSPGPGTYRWQCIVPCGTGYLNGNGGPMQTLGYMQGEIQVEPS